MKGPIETTPVPLYRLAHCRTGDKGDIANIAVVAWNDDCYGVLLDQLTVARVGEWFEDRAPTCVLRYTLPGLRAFNLVLEGVLDGGVNGALNLDAHGKGLSFLLLEMPVPVPRSLVPGLPEIAVMPMGDGDRR
ncbi:hypothetical protein ACLD02_17475 [Alloalcanivorax sp. C16-2]|uniref:AtuA-related protein n=1 Tax=Alloalcanivorax TaxID=3020832 RepID=UPI001932D260|nr:hypothetical protein [Alloalcanivorax marinus]MBL7249902.1 hypothetical protein [Alloalcanivorax marinus]